MYQSWFFLFLLFSTLQKTIQVQAQACHCNPILTCGSGIAVAQLLEVCQNASLTVLKQQEENFFKFLEGSLDLPFELKPRSCDCGSPPPRDCQEIKELDKTAMSGVYMIYPMGSEIGFTVNCDMDTGKGGWTVFQRRENGNVDFYRRWEDYQVGFGNVSSEHWLGLDNINKLVSQDKYELLIDLVYDSQARYAMYKSFFVGPEMTEYMLFIDDYSGDAGDAMARHNGMKFTTKDRDQDIYSNNCAVEYTGAWWYKDCHDVNLNGVYGAVGYKGPRWKGLSDANPVTFAEMKVQRISTCA